MPLVKLDATTSTNDFLKELAANQSLENLTIVTAESQTKGRGQMGAVWNSEKGKNLIMSAYIENMVSATDKLFDINVVVSLAVFRTLKALDIPNVSIKWPNDIMSGNKKLGGILIENLIKSSGEITTIAGIGLNVNQTSFETFPNASSLRNIAGREFDRDIVLNLIVENLRRLSASHQFQRDLHWQEYNNILFRKNVPTTFEDNSGNRFMAKIIGVPYHGQLEVVDESDKVKVYNLKEIKMLY